MAADIYSKAGADAAFVKNTSSGRAALMASEEATSTIDAVAGGAAIRASSPFEGAPYAGFGTSFLKGGGGASMDGYRFAERIGQRLGARPMSNFGASGTRTDQILTAVRTNWVTNSRGLITLCALWNDIDQSGQAASALLTTTEAFRSILAHLSARAIIPITDQGFAFWDGWADGVTSTPGSFLEYAWNGDDAYLLVQATTGAGGSGTVKRGDGTTVTTFSTGGHKYDIIQAVPLLNFGSGDHTVKVTVDSGSVTVLGAIVIGATPPVVCWIQEGISSYWHGNPVATYNSLLTDTYLPACAAIAANFPNVVVVPTGEDWDPAVMTVDGFHPNDIGNRYLTDQAIPRLAAVAQRQGIIVDKSSAANTGVYASPSPDLGGAATVPAQPPTLSAVAGNAQVSLSWTAPPSGGAPITDYEIRYRLVGASTWTSFSHTASTATSRTVTGLTNESSYEFQVAGRNSVGVGAWSVTKVATPSSVTVYAQDDFNRADRTGLGVATSGQTWTEAGATGKWAIVGNKARAANPGGSQAHTYLDAGVTDAVVRATATITGDNGLVLRAIDQNNCYFLYGGSAAGTNYTLRKYTGGSLSTVTLAGGSAVPSANGDALRVVLSGSTISCYVNGTFIGSGTDSTHSGTNYGFRGSGSASTSEYDDFSVRSA